MSQPIQSPRIDVFKTAPIVAGALLLGLIVFAAITIVIRTSGPAAAPPAGALPVITWVAMIAFAIEVPLSILIPKFITRKSVGALVQGKFVDGLSASGANTFSDKLLIVYQTSMIIGLAMLESAGFLGGIAYMIEGNVAGLAIVAGVIAMMLLRFPTKNRIDNWLTKQADMIEQLRTNLAQ